MSRWKTWFRNVWRGKAAVEVAGAYVQTFESHNGRLILADLAVYCRVNQSSFEPGDPHATAFNEGARDCFLHIQQMAGLTWQEINQLGKELTHE